MIRTLLLAGSLFIAATGFSTAQNTQPTGITVTGSGTVKVTPDQVRIEAHVEKKGQSAQTVKKEADQVMSKVLTLLKKEGLDPKNYRTTYVRLDKKRDYKTKEEYYVASQSISITLNNIDGYENIMDKLMKAGINHIDGVYFEDSKLKEHQAEARRKAAKDALQKATDYASVLGLKVGPALMISENGGSRPSPRRLMAMNVSFSADGTTSKKVEENLAVGQIKVTETVQIRFALGLK